MTWTILETSPEGVIEYTISEQKYLVPGAGPMPTLGCFG
jgi:hypothetical protein